MLKEKIPYLERQAPVHGGEIPKLPGPLLGANCQYAPCPPLTPVPTSPQKDIYLHTIYTQTTLTCPLLLSGTKMTVTQG
jgi:hypothetical protein